MSAELIQNAKALVAKGKGILAADESTGTVTKRFDGIGAECTEATRREYRGLLFTTEGAAEHVSGVILYDETLRQATDAGTPFSSVLTDQGILPGIKVDTGAKELSGTDGEKITEGLDGLRDRVAEYYALGARFAKWRAVITIGNGIPSDYCIDTNAHALARYAKLCQEGGLVPIVEPEVLMEGDHSAERCEAVTTRVLQRTFGALFEQGVLLEGMLLKPNMVLSGTGCADQAGVAEVAERTLRCFGRVVPAAVPGVVFLSGGQSDELATAHLSAMNAMGPHPWEVSFSYGRALQAPALKAWAGRTENIGAAQAAYLHRARCNGAARSGAYSAAMETAGV